MRLTIINSNSDELFTYESKNPTLRDAVKEAHKQGVSLRGALLQSVDLSGLRLEEIDLREANLYEARLSRASLYKADLRGAFLDSTDLSNAVLTKANLSNANLSFSNLSHAYMTGANLLNANLHKAQTYMTSLRGAKNIPYIPLACPSDGEFVAWKKVVVDRKDMPDEYLIKLRVPEDARRSSATGRKCRCDKAEVLEITNIETGEPLKSIINHVFGVNTTYTVGEIVYPDGFNENRWIECAKGIHFFINKQDALNYGN